MCVAHHPDFSPSWKNDRTKFINYFGPRMHLHAVGLFCFNLLKLWQATWKKTGNEKLNFLPLYFMHSSKNPEEAELEDILNSVVSGSEITL